jgi:NADPH-dependent ferric siderophore reductase
MVRVVVGGNGMRAFTPSEHADSYVKLVFLPPSAGAARPLLDDGRVDLDSIVAALGPGDQPRRRSYTVRAFDPAARELTLDLVVHGDEGLAGPWAACTVPGDEVLMLGPGGDYSPDPSADHHLVVGDASALPAIAVALERLADEAPDARGDAVIEVHGPDDELALTAPAGVTIRWVHQGVGVVGLGLVEAVRDLPWPAGRVHAFVHGEAGAVKELRHLLRVERGLPREQLSISGYWRLGADDEGWRATKRDWNRTIEDAERVAGVV